MSVALTGHLQRAPVVPLVQASDPVVAIDIAAALIEGGLAVIEVVLRTEQALECLQSVAAAFPGALIGAGTVLNASQAHAAIDAGAAFVVSPGLDDGVVNVAQKAGVPIFPGIATATELQRAWNLGLDVVKFFPASLSGGVPMIKALASVFSKVRFMPTGGVSAENLPEFLALPAVIACGGSWLTPAKAISTGDYAAITRLARDAIAISNHARES